MRAVTEYLPVDPREIVNPPTDTSIFPDRLLTTTVHDDCVFYPSARAAIRGALLDAGIKERSEVLVPGYTCYAVREAVADVAEPVYIDVTDAFTMDVGAAAAAITEDTAAIVPIHQYGIECDMAAVGDLAADHGLTIVEDAAQATSNLLLSDQVGTGDYTVLSFRYFKEVTAFSGGLLLGTGGTTEPAEQRGLIYPQLLGVWIVHQAMRLLPGPIYQRLRAQLLDPLARDSSGALGPTDPVLLDNWTSSTLDAQLTDIPRRTERRRTNAAVYRKHLPDDFTLPPSPGHNTYVRYPIRVPESRDALLQRLRRAGVGASPMWSYTIAPDGTCPTSHRIAEEILVLPVHSGLSPADAEDIARTIRRVWATL